MKQVHSPSHDPAARTTRALLVFLLLPAIAAAQEPSLDTVLARAADYVAAFHQQLSGIVAEESYSQESRRPGLGAQRRRLTSDFLLVLPPRADRYVEFRDVFAVDGRAIRDRDERLFRLFLDPAATADQAHAIIEESARLNIGGIPRNLNTPMLPLNFLLPAQQPRFRFRRVNRRMPDLTGHGAPAAGVATFRVTTDVWVIAFEESRRGTVIRSYEGHDFPAAGRFWIDPASGAVLMSELVMERTGIHAVIDVSYQSEPLIGFRVPIEMRERYVTRDERIDGVATYGRFRQFTVRTDEWIGTPSVPGKKPGPGPGA